MSAWKTGKKEAPQPGGVARLLTLRQKARLIKEESLGTPLHHRPLADGAEEAAFKPPACREVSEHSDCQDRPVGPVLEPA